MSLRENANAMWHVQRVKRLVRDHMGAGAPCLVSVREAMCNDPACEGLATEIRIITLSFDEIVAAVHKPVTEVTAADVAGAL